MPTPTTLPLRRLGLLTVVMIVGCGPSAPETYPVSGTVTWNGEPLTEGDILFIPMEGAKVPDPGKIKEGKFSCRVKAGKARVEIHATRQGKFDPVMQSHEREPFLPQRYNAESILSEEVLPRGENRFHFPLSDQP